MAKMAKKQALPDLACPRCGHHDTVPLRNYGRPMVGETAGTSSWQCLECSHRFDGPKVRR
jgi:DNA-directed RNA polymerase subunit RPC12/RpoP